MPVDEITQASVSERTQVLAILACVLFVGLILYLIKNNRVKPGHAIVWMIFGVFLFTVSVFNSLLDLVSMMVGIYYPPAAFFMIVIGALILVLLHFSILLSRQEHQIIQVIQELGLTQQELKKQSRKRRKVKRKRKQK